MDSTFGGTLEVPCDLEPETPAREWSWTSRVVPRGSGRHVLYLSGSLHAAWAGRLAAGLAARHISVVRATARRTATRWTAEIEFDVLDPKVEPSAIDFIALLREPPDAPLGARGPRIARHRVARTRRDVLVEIRAEDAVGLLARILLVFGELGLFPREMRVETIGSEVRDAFRLQTAEGEVPAEGTVAALRARLDALVPA
jgi:hypothetical protein